MAGLMVVVPSAEASIDGVKLLEAAGLGELTADGDETPVVLSDAVTLRLPERPEVRGRLIFWDPVTRPESSPQPVGIKPDVQTWYECKPRDGLAAGRAFVGWWNKRPPTPADLQRKRTHVGRDVVLADKQAWHVPIVRELPTVYGFGDDGAMRAEFAEARYRRAFENAYDALQRLQIVGGEGEAPQAQLTKEEYFRLSAEVLGLNYRVNVDVVAALKLIGSDSLDVLLAACGLETDPVAQKKTGSGMSAGAAA